ISSIESAITSREMTEARMPGVPCDWLSETAIVLNSSGTPPASATPAATSRARSRWFRLHGIVPVQVEAMPMIGLSRRPGSMPIARKCARAPARPAACASPARLTLLAGIQEPLRVERLLQAQVQVVRVRTELVLELAALQPADAVLAGHRAAEPERELEQLVARRVGPRLLPGLVGSEEERRVDVAVSGVAE